MSEIVTNNNQFMKEMASGQIRIPGKADEHFYSRLNELLCIVGSVVTLFDRGNECLNLFRPRSRRCCWIFDLTGLKPYSL